MKIDKRLRAVIVTGASSLRDKLLDDYVVHCPDLAGVKPEEQMLTKICVLVAACESITAAAEELNKRLSPTVEEEEETKEEENKEWN